MLGQAIKGCNVGNTADSLAQSQCFGANSLYTNDEMAACTIKPTVNEDIGIVNPGQKDGHGVRGGVLSALPGCNPVQPGPGPATKASCAGGTAPTVAPVASSATSSAATAAHVLSSVSKPVPVGPTTLSSKLATSATTAATKPSPTSGGGSSSSGGSSSGGSSSGLLPLTVQSTSGEWKAVGCFLDAVNPRSLGKQPEWWGQQITSSNCVKHCDSIGAKYAGTENEGQCFCGNQLIKSGSRPGKCTSKCNGDNKEICGGPGFLSIYSRDGTVSTKKRAAHPHHSRHFQGGI